MALPLSPSAIVRDPRVTLLSRPDFVEPEHLPVQWVGEATAGERLAEYAGRLRHMSQRNPAERSTREFLDNIKKQGHGSVFGHASYSLLVEGVSCALSHELVRHRAGFATSPLSPYAVDESEVRFVLPPAIAGDEAAEALWSSQMALALERYRELVDAVMTRFGWIDDKVQRRRMARDAARSVLPNSTETRLVVTGNARAWRFLLEAHAGETADLEFRRLAVSILRVLQREAAGFFSDFAVYQAPDRRDAVRAAYQKG
jgi:thymidylate synthase (FAD)